MSRVLIYPRFISNVIKIIETKVHKLNNLHLKCIHGFMELLENLVFVEVPRFLLQCYLVFGLRI